LKNFIIAAAVIVLTAFRRLNYLEEARYFGYLHS